MNEILNGILVTLVIADFFLLLGVILLFLILDAVEGGFDVNLEHPKARKWLRELFRPKATAILLALLGSVFSCWAADGEEPTLAATEAVHTNIASNVQTSKGWRRYHVIGEEGGTLKDASGKIADYLTGETVKASAAYCEDLAAAAHEGMTNALSQLYAVTNRISQFEGRIYIAGDLQASQERANIWCYIASETFTGREDVFNVWFSRELGNAPHMTFRYRTELGEEYVSGVWENWQITHDTNGFQRCHQITVTRPQTVGAITMRTDPYPKFGTPEGGFDFAKKVFYLTTDENTVTNLPWTGIWTNSTGRVLQWNNGIYMGEVEND